MITRHGFALMRFSRNSSRCSISEFLKISMHKGDVFTAIVVWRAKAGNRIVKATAKEIECPLLNRQLVANYPRLCWFP